MKITVNRAAFLEKAPLIPLQSNVSLLVENGILTIASFSAKMTLKVVGYMLEPGQAFLTAEQWHELVYHAHKSEELVIDIAI